MTSPKEVRLVLRREIVNFFDVEKDAEKQERESVNKNGKISKRGKVDICNFNLNICKKGSFFDTQTLLKSSCLIAMAFSGYRWDIVINLIKSHVNSLTYLSSKLVYCKIIFICKKRLKVRCFVQKTKFISQMMLQGLDAKVKDKACENDYFAKEAFGWRAT